MFACEENCKAYEECYTACEERGKACEESSKACEESGKALCENTSEPPFWKKIFALLKWSTMI